MAPEEYEKKYFGTEATRFVSNAEIKALMSCLEGFTKDAILEIGMGPGRILRELIKHNLHVIGMDVNPKMAQYFIKTHHHTLSSLTGTTDIVVADGHYLPFKESTVNGIVCIRVLKYLHDPETGISEMSRVLKRGGTLILELSNIFSWAFLAQLPSRFSEGRFFPRLFRLRVIQDLLAKHSLTVKSVTPLHKVPPKIWNIAKSSISLRILIELNSILLKITPKQLMSRGLLVLAKKTAARENTFQSLQ